MSEDVQKRLTSSKASNVGVCCPSLSNAIFTRFAWVLQLPHLLAFVETGLMGNEHLSYSIRLAEQQSIKPSEPDIPIARMAKNIAAGWQFTQPKIDHKTEDENRSISSPMKPSEKMSFSSRQSNFLRGGLRMSVHVTLGGLFRK